MTPEEIKSELFVFFRRPDGAKLCESLVALVRYHQETETARLRTGQLETEVLRKINAHVCAYETITTLILRLYDEAIKNED